MPDPIGGLLLKVAETAFPEILRRVSNDRWTKAQAIINRRIARGSISSLLDDRAAYAVWLYFRAAADGAAARNLELIAQAVVSEIKDPTLFEEELKRVTDVLAGLSREEAIVVGTLIKASALHTAGEIDQPWAWATEHLTGPERLFPDKKVLDAHAYALVRTGWVVPVSAYGMLVLRPTVLLDIAAKMVDFEDPFVVRSAI